VDASGISSAKAHRMLGWQPKRSWRDYLDENGNTRDKDWAPAPPHPVRRKKRSWGRLRDW
jgi:hypothetical protein